MNNPLENYVRRGVAATPGYVPGVQPIDSRVIKLNTNENPYPPSPRVLEAIKASATDELRLYPEPTSLAIRTALAELYGLSPENFIAGNGSDEILSILLRTFVEENDTVVLTDLTYTLYQVLAGLQGGKLKIIELDGRFQLPQEPSGAQGKLFFLANPNAPTGVLHPIEDVVKLCHAFDGIVAVDEAYVDFSRQGCVALLKDHDNLVITRTLSKSFSLAGIRSGFAAASSEIVDYMMRVKDSYNMSRLAQAATLAALKDAEWMRENARKIMATRDRLTAALDDLGLSPYRSESNFVLVDCGSIEEAVRLFEGLGQRKIYVRYFDLPRVNSCLRITIGLDKEIDALLEALSELTG